MNDDPRRIKKVAKCKVRGDRPEELHLSTRKPKQPVVVPSIPPPQLPPQAAALSTEYIHSLKMQEVFLDNELKMVKDRAGLSTQDGYSVDASIRRLRMACSKHEEETRHKIEEYEQEIEEKMNELNSLDEDRALDILKCANQREDDGLNSMESAFVELSADVITRQLQFDHFNRAASFHENQCESIEQKIVEQKQKYEEQESMLHEIDEQIYSLRDQRKALMNKNKEIIKSRMLKEEEADIISSLAMEKEGPPPNLPLTTINAKNAKIEMELKSTLATRGEIEHQVDLLLEKNIRIKAQLNEVKYQLERAKTFRAQMEEQFGARYLESKKNYEDYKNEIASLKRVRKDMKSEIESLNETYNKAISRINECRTEQQLANEVIDFKTQEKDKIDEENEKTRKEIHMITDNIVEMRGELDEITHKIADASEKLRNVEVLVEINKQNPQCVLQTPPPELAQLFESLNAVRTAMC